MWGKSRVAWWSLFLFPQLVVANVDDKPIDLDGFVASYQPKDDLCILFERPCGLMVLMEWLFESRSSIVWWAVLIAV